MNILTGFLPVAHKRQQRLKLKNMPELNQEGAEDPFVAVMLNAVLATAEPIQTLRFAANRPKRPTAGNELSFRLRTIDQIVTAGQKLLINARHFNRLAHLEFSSLLAEHRNILKPALDNFYQILKKYETLHKKLVFYALEDTRLLSLRDLLDGKIKTHRTRVVQADAQFALNELRKLSDEILISFEKIEVGMAQFHQTLKSIRKPTVQPPFLGADELFFLASHPEIIREHRGEWVALTRTQLLGADKDLSSLSDQFKEKNALFHYIPRIDENLELGRGNYRIQSE